jgi:cytochrome c
MKRVRETKALTAAITILAGLAIASVPDRLMAQAANPCAAKPMNPCAPKAANPCSPMQAAGDAAVEVDPKLVLRPKGIKPQGGNPAQLAKEGKALFNDPKLSTNGMSCATCHVDNQANFAPGFAKPYPHEVAMVNQKSGLSQVQLDEMVQFCMVVPMAAKPLPWDSRQLAALTAYAAELQAAFRKQSTNTGAAKAANPCAPKAANPCAPRK